jgi:hypothetical protein
MIKRGYVGLGTLKRAASLRPAQIVRQTIPNLDTHIAPYHRYKGLSSPLKNQGIKRIYQTSIGSIWTYAGYVDMRFVR